MAKKKHMMFVLTIDGCAEFISNTTDGILEWFNKYRSGVKNIDVWVTEFTDGKKTDCAEWKDFVDYMS